jgi:hypothetical protein
MELLDISYKWGQIEKHSYSSLYQIKNYGLGTIDQQTSWNVD